MIFDRFCKSLNPTSKAWKFRLTGTAHMELYVPTGKKQAVLDEGGNHSSFKNMCCFMRAIHSYTLMFNLWRFVCVVCRPHQTFIKKIERKFSNLYIKIFTKIREIYIKYWYLHHTVRLQKFTAIAKLTSQTMFCQTVNQSFVYTLFIVVRTVIAIVKNQSIENKNIMNLSLHYN